MSWGQWRDNEGIFGFMVKHGRYWFGHWEIPVIPREDFGDSSMIKKRECKFHITIIY